MLTDSRMLEKFHVVNRIRNSVKDIFDMSNIRLVFHRVLEFFPELDQFLLEKYHIPSSFYDLQNRIQRDSHLYQYKLEDYHDVKAAEKRIKISKYIQEMTSFIWILEKKVENYEDLSNNNSSSKHEPGIVKWTMPVNP